MDLLSAWFCIVFCLLMLSAALLSAIMVIAGGNRDRLAELMAAHEKNLQSDDPQTVADSKARWAEICKFLKNSRHTYRHGAALESFGRAAEQMFAKPPQVTP